MNQAISRRPRVLLVHSDRDLLARLAVEAQADDCGWELDAQPTTEDAFRRLERGAVYDVVITALSGPGIKGLAMLQHLRLNNPLAIRMVVSEVEAPDAAARTAALAHQFLPNLLDAGHFRRAIDRSLDLVTHLGHPDLREMLGELATLPGPSASVRELNTLSLDNDASVEDVSRVIESDPAMTAKLLQLVNSAFFGLTHRVTNVQHAVSYLGFDTVRNVLSALQLVNALPAPTAELGRAVEDIQAHSLVVADLARDLMGRNRAAHDAFAAGMLHDIGLLAIVSCMPKKFELLQLEVIRGGRPFAECEQEILGAPHAQIGAYLLGLWGLPASIVAAVALSHDSQVASGNTLTAAQAVYVAEQLSNLVGTGGWAWEDAHMPDPEFLIAVGVDSAVTRLVSHARS